MNSLPQSIRAVLLDEIHKQEPRDSTSANLQQNSVLDAAFRRLGNKFDQALLTQWGDLFRTGLLAWGLNISNPGPPFVHVTERGRAALANLTRDPSNPAGYLAHLNKMATIDPIAISYLTEGLDCYVAGLFKAGAVMVGASAERIIIDLRDTVENKLIALSKPIPPNLKDWRIKIVTDTLQSFLDGQKSHFDRDLRAVFEAYWTALSAQIRTTRNEAGHPTSVDPISADNLHASLLIFPELAKLVFELKAWVVAHLS